MKAKLMLLKNKKIPIISFFKNYSDTQILSLAIFNKTGAYRLKVAVCLPF